MDANDLADRLEEFYKGTHIQKAAETLRQQAKELDEAGGMIGVLREYISDLENGLESSIKLNKAQAKRQNTNVT